MHLSLQDERQLRAGASHPMRIARASTSRPEFAHRPFIRPQVGDRLPELERDTFFLAVQAQLLSIARCLVTQRIGGRTRAHADRRRAVISNRMAAAMWGRELISTYRNTCLCAVEIRSETGRRQKPPAALRVVGRLRCWRRRTVGPRTTRIDTTAMSTYVMMFLLTSISPLPC